MKTFNRVLTLGLILLTFAACEKDKLIEEVQQIEELESIEEIISNEYIHPIGRYCAKDSQINCIEAFEDYYIITYNNTDLGTERFDIEEIEKTVVKEGFKYSITANKISYSIFIQWWDNSINNYAHHTKFFYTDEYLNGGN